MDETKQISIDLPTKAVNVLESVEGRLGVSVPVQVRTIVLHYIENNKAVIRYDGGRSLLFDEMGDQNQTD